MQFIPGRARPSVRGEVRGPEILAVIAPRTSGWRFEVKAIREGGQLTPELEFLVNGQSARFLRGPHTAHGPKDGVVVFIHRSGAEMPFV